MTDVVDDFIEQYIKAFDYYETAARMVSQILAAKLDSAGVRCIVTNRAKSISSLRDKCRQRHTRREYESVDDIYRNIVDLAGARVATYFPNDRRIVDTEIKQNFTILEEPKRFPEVGKTRAGNPRFEGYSATHYRVALREDTLPEPDKRYAAAKVEIQVASVLMHAWSEVEHDLVYKPGAGDLSDEEYALLDQLNGLVMSGEIALEALQKAGERRVGETGRKLRDRFELAAHLLTRPAVAAEEPETDTGPGRVDRLFSFLHSMSLDTPNQIDGYIDVLKGNIDARPLSDQVVDAVLLDDPKRYEYFSKVRRDESLTRRESSSPDAAVGKFINSWIAFEILARELSGNDPKRRINAVGRDLYDLGIVDQQTQNKIENLRRLRNVVVHGVEAPDPKRLSRATVQLDDIVAKLRDRSESPNRPDES